MKNANDDKWTLIESRHEGKPILIRARRFVDGVDRASYPVRLNIFWQMLSPDENGLASTDDTPALEAFEERLVQAVDVDAQSVLSVILTGHGRREYVFHTADPNEFLRRLMDMPQEEDPYPIEIHRTDDPDWEYDQAVTATG